MNTNPTLSCLVHSVRPRPDCVIRQRQADAVRNALILAELKRRDKRFTGAGPTGFGSL